MTQSPEHPEEREPSHGAVPQPPHEQPSAQPGDASDPPLEPPSTPPPPQSNPQYAAAPPITEPYGGYGPPGASAQYGGRWPRLFAGLIDGIIVGVIGSIVSAPFAGFGMMYEPASKHMGARLTANLITAVIGVIYYGFQHGKWGQTIGKRALSLRVVRADDGGAITYGTAAWRTVFSYLIGIITCGIGGIVDVAWILGDQRRQALHDKVAKTIAVTADGPDPYAGR